MVPCPWFLEIADMATADPSLDLGMHLTLTAYGPNKHLVGVSESEFGDFVELARRAGMPIFDSVPETNYSR
jgi:hypothetical protein